MASFNKIVLVGNLGRDVEIKALEGVNVLTFNMAVSQKWNDKDGNPKSIRTGLPLTTSPKATHSKTTSSKVRPYS